MYHFIYHSLDPNFSMKTLISLRHFAIALCCCFLLISYSACNTDPTDIGNGLINDDELLNSTSSDTATLIVNTQKTDTVYTSNYYTTGRYLLGTLNDPTFGKSTAGIYAQGYMLSTSFSPDLDSALVDSIVLSLRYEQGSFVYGDPESLHDIAVYEVTEPLGLALNTRYGHTEFAYNPVPLGYTSGVKFAPNDSTLLRNYVKIGSGDTARYETQLAKSAPQVRVRLSDEFGYALLGRGGTNTLQSNETFQSFFKGVYVSTSGGNSMSFFDFDNSSYIALYYRNGNAPDKLGKSFVISLSGNSSAASNHYTHYYDNSAVETALSLPNNGQEMAYLQGMGGTQVEIELPHINAWDDYLLNKIELDLSVLPNSDENGLYTPPPPSIPLVSDSTLVEDVMAIYGVDTLQAIQQLGYYDGTSSSPIDRIVETDDAGNEVIHYKINLTRYLPSLKTGRFTKLLLAIRGNFYNAIGAARYSGNFPYRAIICGPEHPQYPMRLKILYTETE